MNYSEGYNLFFEDDNQVRFLLFVKPYNHVKGKLRGGPGQLALLTQAMEADEWHVGTAEALRLNEREELHVTVTNENTEVDATIAAQTVAGVDINEDCVAQVALSESRLKVTIRKRMLKAEQTAFNKVFRDKEQRFVHDHLHTVSRRVVEWIQRVRYSRDCL